MLLSAEPAFAISIGGFITALGIAFGVGVYVGPYLNRAWIRHKINAAKRKSEALHKSATPKGL